MPADDLKPFVEKLAATAQIDPQKLSTFQVPSGKTAILATQQGDFKKLVPQTIKESYLDKEDRRTINEQLVSRALTDIRKDKAATPQSPITFQYVNPKSQLMTYQLPLERMAAILDPRNKKKSARKLVTRASRKHRAEELLSCSPKALQEKIAASDLGWKFEARVLRSTKTLPTLHKRSLWAAPQNLKDFSGIQPDDPSKKQWMVGAVHFHTRDYSDGKYSMRQIVRLAHRMGLNFMAISDHKVNPKHPIGIAAKVLDKAFSDKQVDSYLSDIAKIAKEYEGKLIVMPGQEVNRDSLNARHAYHLGTTVTGKPFNTNKVYKKDGIVDIMEKLHSEGDIGIANHPGKLHTRIPGITTLGLLPQEYSPLLDSYEAGQRVQTFVEAAQPNRTLVGSPDLHKLSHQYGFYTVVFAEPKPEAIKRAYRDGEDLFLMCPDRKIVRQEQIIGCKDWTKLPPADLSGYPPLPKDFAKNLGRTPEQRQNDRHARQMARETKKSQLAR